MVCESWQGGCRGNADSQGAKYNSTPSYKNREHKKDERRQTLMENATEWQEERAPGRQHQQQQGRACPYCTVLGPGHGERAAPAPGTSLSTQKWKKKGREHWSKQTQLSQH